MSWSSSSATLVIADNKVYVKMTSSVTATEWCRLSCLLSLCPCCHRSLAAEHRHGHGLSPLRVRLRLQLRRFGLPGDGAGVRRRPLAAAPAPTRQAAGADAAGEERRRRSVLVARNPLALWPPTIGRPRDGRELLEEQTLRGRRVLPPVPEADECFVCSLPVPPPYDARRYENASAPPRLVHEGGDFDVAMMAARAPSRRDARAPPTRRSIRRRSRAAPAPNCGRSAGPRAVGTGVSVRERACCGGLEEPRSIACCIASSKTSTARTPNSATPRRRSASCYYPMRRSGQHRAATATPRPGLAKAWPAFMNHDGRVGGAVRGGGGPSGNVAFIDKLTSSDAAARDYFDHLLRVAAATPPWSADQQYNSAPRAAPWRTAAPRRLVANGGRLLSERPLWRLRGDRRRHHRGRCRNIGASGSGAVYVFRKGDGGAGAAGQVAKLTASDAAGATTSAGPAVAIDGSTIVVGPPAMATPDPNRWVGARPTSSALTDAVTVVKASSGTNCGEGDAAGRHLACVIRASGNEMLWEYGMTRSAIMITTAA